MIYRLRSGQSVRGNDGQDRLLSLIYGNAAGRALVKLLIRPGISKAGGAFLNSPFSAWFIEPFIRRNHIDRNDYEDAVYASYNAFFTRRVKDGKRPIDRSATHLIAPCDGKLFAYPIREDGRFHIKQTCYTLESLLRNGKLAKRYRGGTALIFRLTVDDYHRYCYPMDGEKSRNVRIPGVLHTVNPAANDVCPVYKENAREYCLLKTAQFKTVLMMEVGALMVGKIHNYQSGRSYVSRGEEKGMFEFGGSTVILLLEPDVAGIDADILANTALQVETIVKMGEKIGECSRCV